MVLAFGFVQSAQAMEVTFNFNAYSSGADIYPCNAGQRLVPPNLSCHLVNSTASCASGTSGCVCNSFSVATETQDFITGTLTNWDLSGTPTSVRQQPSTGVGNGAEVALVSDGTDFAHRLTNLSFNFGSETYDEQYFVDICYRGPQIDYWQNDVGINMTLSGAMTVTDLAGITGSAANYVSLSGVVMYPQVVCDVQGLGANTTAAGVGGYNSLSMDLNGSFGPADIFYNFGRSWSLGTGITSVFQGLALSQTVPSPTGATVQFNGVPRYCKIRYAFQELSQTTRSWQIHGATIQTFTQVQAN